MPVFRFRLSISVLLGSALIACDGGSRAPVSDSVRDAVKSPPAPAETTQAPATTSETEWTRADAATLRLAPDSFPALPEVVRADMKRRGCAVPQSPEIAERHNVISGAFIQAGQTDWAVLCSIKRASRVLVYRAGRADVVDSLGVVADIDFLQGLGGNTIGFSRRIGAVNRKYIEEHAAAYDGPKPPPLDHDGIEDAFMGKASGIAYFYQGKWIGLQGAD